MDIEQNELNEQTIYPRVLYEQMEQFRGRKVTLVGNVHKEDSNDSLVIECGATGLNYLVVVDNQRKTDLNENTKFVEVRGVILNQNVINCEELTEFEQNEPFDFETYGKFINLTYNDKLKHLFFDN